MSVSAKKVCTANAGSVSFVVLIRTTSNSGSACWSKRLSIHRRLPQTVQQTQMLFIWKTSSLVSKEDEFMGRRSRSAFSMPNLFLITTMQRPCQFDWRMWLKSVVLPAPRKPVWTVQRTQFLLLFFLSWLLPWVHDTNSMTTVTVRGCSHVEVGGVSSCCWCRNIVEVCISLCWFQLVAKSGNYIFF